MNITQFKKTDLLTDVDLWSLKEKFINNRDESALDILVSYFFDLGRLHNQNMGDSQLKIFIKDIMTSYLSMKDRPPDFFKYVIQELTYYNSSSQLENELKRIRKKCEWDSILNDQELLNLYTWHYMFHAFVRIDDDKNYDEMFANYYLLIRSYIAYHIKNRSGIKYINSYLKTVCDHYEQYFSPSDRIIPETNVRNGSVTDLLSRASAGDPNAINELFMKKKPLIDSKIEEMLVSLERFYKAEVEKRMAENGNYKYLDFNFEYQIPKFAELLSDIYFAVIILIEDVLIKYKGRYGSCNFSSLLNVTINSVEQAQKSNIENILNGLRPSILDGDRTNEDYLASISLEQEAGSTLQDCLARDVALISAMGANLDDKSQRILYLISQGKTQVEIGKALGVSKQAISQRIKEIRKSLGAGASNNSRAKTLVK